MATWPGGRQAEGTPVLAAGASLLGDQDLHLLNEGTHHRLYEKLGAHLVVVDGRPGVFFAVWAPNAARVSVIGRFNDWDRERHPLRRRAESGVWEVFVPDIAAGTPYKYHVVSGVTDHAVDKADPFGVRHEIPPRTGSVVWDLSYQWGDEAWLSERKARNSLGGPGLHLRGSPRLVATRARRGQPRAELPRAGAAGSPTTSSGWASPTSSSCR